MRHSINLGMMLGFQDVKQAYRRSKVGPFWITIGMAVQIATIGIVFGMLFKISLADYLPFLTISLIIWGFISGSLNDGCMTFINSEAILKQIDLPIYVYPVRLMTKNIILLGHNSVILPLVFLAFGHNYSPVSFLFIPGVVLLILNLSWMTILLGIASTRFRDLPPIINSLILIIFYVTPVMWKPDGLPGGLAHFLLGLNPFYHLIQITRLPLMGTFPTIENWVGSFFVLILGTCISIFALRATRWKIVYWL